MRLLALRTIPQSSREKLKEASREVKKLERLEEIKRDQYIVEAESFLQKENDEIASNVRRGSQPS